MTAVDAPPASDVAAVFAMLCDTDPACADRDELAALVAGLRRVRSWCDAHEVRIARRSRELADTGRCEPATSLLGEHGKRSGKDTRAAEERSEICDQLAGIETALAAGDVTAEHLDAIACARRTLDDAGRAEFDDHHDTLLAAARAERIETFQRRCRELGRRIRATQEPDVDELTRQRRQSKISRFTDRTTGMHHTRIELDPLRDSAMWSVIDAHLARLRRQPDTSKLSWNELQIAALLATFDGAVTGVPTQPGCQVPSAPATATTVEVQQALASMAERLFGDPAPAHPPDTPMAGSTPPGTGSPPGRPPLPSRAELKLMGARVPEISVHVDLDTLTHRLDGPCETRNGAPIPVDTVRRLACDAEIIPIVLGSTSVPLDQGRSVRTATPAQRAALAAMYAACAHPDCTMPYTATRAHHVRHWTEHRGPTDIDNLLPLCDHHHHQVHEGGWGITLQPDRTATWHRPDGTTWWTGTTINRTPPTP